MNTQLGVDTQRAYYDKRWAGEAYANNLQLQRLIAILEGLHRLRLLSPKILDLGCGTGWLTTILGRFGPTTGTDLSLLAVQKAKARYPDVRFIAAEFFDLEATTEAYDVIVSQEVIEHVEDQTCHLDLIARSLRPGGHLILTTPNAWNFTHWERTQIEQWGIQPIEKRLTRGQLRMLLRPRFRILRISTIIFGYGHRGVFRIVNSEQLKDVLQTLRMLSLYERVLGWAGFGLHITVLATKR